MSDSILYYQWFLPPSLQKAENASESGSTDSIASVNTKKWHEEIFCVGTMVWGKLPGYCWWPGVVISYGGLESERDDVELPGESNFQAWVKWFGETQLSRVS